MPLNNTSEDICLRHLGEYTQITGANTVAIINGILNAVLVVPTTVGNLLVLVVIWRTQSLHSPSNFLLASLAVSDLGVGLVANPLFVIYYAAILTQNASVFCIITKVLNIVAIVLSSASLATATAASVDRYLAITLHLRYQETVSNRRVMAVVLAIWAIGGTQGVIQAAKIRSGEKRLHLYLAITFIALSIATTSLAYLKIYRVVRHHARNINKQRMQLETSRGQPRRTSSEKQAMENCHKIIICMFSIFCALVLCYTPFICILAMQFFVKWNSKMILALEFSNTFMFANSLFNPIIYCWRLKSIRAEVKRFLRRPHKSSNTRIHYERATLTGQDIVTLTL